jgi:hypothetical protein
MNWNGNVYRVNDGRLVQFAGLGFNNYNILGANESNFQFAGDKSPLSWEGSEEITEALPGQIRIGASYNYFRTIHIGFDVVIPRNDVAGNLEQPLFAIGGDFQAFKTLRFSTGLNAGGNNDSRVNIPLGATYTARRGFYEAGIATRDVVTYFANAGGGSTISLALGFLRFKI